MSGLSVVGCGALLATLVAIAVPQPAHAATVVVNTVVDAASGGCENSGTGPNCTLRQAIIFANAHPGTVITVPAGTYNLTLGGPFENAALTGDLDILESVTINGAGPQATIIAEESAGTKDRIFDISAVAGTHNVSINGVQLTKGSARDAFGGGAVWIGEHMNVTLTNTVLDHNDTFDGLGGQIVVYGQSSHLSIIGSVVSNGIASSNSGESPVTGGGIYMRKGTLDVVDSAIVGNSAVGADATDTPAGDGGGTGRGGGLFLDGGSTASVVRSLIAHNLAQGGNGEAGAGNEVRGGLGAGGGIVGTGTAQLTITNSTLTDNIARGGGSSSASGIGGQGLAGGASIGGPLSAAHLTIADNLAQGGNAPTRGIAVGGGLQVTSEDGSIVNSIIAGNALDPPSVAPLGIDLYISFELSDNNLIGIADDGTLPGPADMAGTTTAPLDPRLAFPLADNGGDTETLGLLPDSPAINAATTDACVAAGSVDQRGFARPNPAGGLCDIGAFEYAFTPTAIALVSSVNPAQVGQAITFTATVSGAGGTPSGIVTIMDGATSIGGGAVAGGVVALTTAALAKGTHSITAQYSGDDVFAPTSTSIAQVVVDPASSSGGLQFYPLPRPVRLLDTRPGQSAFVQPGTALVANQQLSLPGRVTIDGVAIPADAQALVGNATVDNTAGVPAGFATLWPGGSSLPLASNLNFVPGTVRPNQFTVGLGSDGTFNLLSNTGGHFIIDITGYYAPPAPGGLYFHPLPQPVRLLDTRAGASAFVHPASALTPGQTMNLPGRFTSAGVTVPASAAALAGNATVDNSINAPAGFATLFPGGTPLPPTSNLNYAAGTVAPNAFTVALGSDGSFNLFSQSGGNFVVDITGYYDSVPAGGLLLHALTQPVRELDTRLGASASVHPNAPVSAAGTLNLPGSFTLAGITVPTTATALVGNATVDNSVNAPSGFATIYPGATTLPLASNLNYSPGLVAPNAFIVGVGTDGTYNLFSQSETNYIIDISGYFATS